MSFGEPSYIILNLCAIVLINVDTDSNTRDIISSATNPPNSPLFPQIRKDIVHLTRLSLDTFHLQGFLYLLCCPFFFAALPEHLNDIVISWRAAR